MCIRDSLDRVGLLTDISAVFSELKTNIRSAKVHSFPNKTAIFNMAVEIDSVDHLNNLIAKIGGLSDILDVRRTGYVKEEE